MNRTVKIVFGSTLIFLSGSVVGGVGTALYAKRTMRMLSDGGPEARGMVMRRLTHELQLTPEQRMRFAEVVEDTQNRLLEQRRQRAPEMAQTVDGAMERMRPFLSPEQDEKLNKLRQRMFRRMQYPATMGSERRGPERRGPVMMRSREIGDSHNGEQRNFR